MRRIQSQLRQKPNSARLYTILGRLYQKQHAYTKAKRAYRKALQLKPRYVHAQVGWLQLHLLFLGQSKAKSEAALQRLLRRHPRVASVWFLNAAYARRKAQNIRGAARKRQLRKAVVGFQKAIDLAPRNSQYRYTFALLLLSLEMGPPAYMHLRKAIQLSKGHPCYALGALVSMQMIGKSDPQARTLFARRLKQCPHRLTQTLAEPFYIRLVLEHVQALSHKQRKQAYRTLQAARIQFPENEKAAVFHAMMHYQDRQCDRGDQLLRKLLHRHPEYKTARTLLQRSRNSSCSFAKRDRKSFQSTSKRMRQKPSTLR
ncbi:MAG: tetratricopeptide repeat protein [Myxococcota bacterium]